MTEVGSRPMPAATWTARARAALVVLAVLAASLTVVAVTADPTPAGAAPPAPVILNAGAQNGGNAQWLETQALPDDGGVRQVWVTFLVQHALGRGITGLRSDVDFDGIDETASVGTFAVTPQTITTGGFSAIETSRLTVPITVSKPAGFACDFFTGTRSVDAPVRFRVVDHTGEASASVSGTVRFVEDTNCNARADLPRLTSASQTATEAVPGQSITYSFTCDDADTDVFSSDDDCDRANIRWRRLDDGTTSAITLKTGINDSQATSHTMSFPSQGHYVVEAQLGNEDGSFPNSGGTPGGWWRLGNAVVNDGASSLTGSIAFPGASPSSPPSVNAGTPMSAVATATDAGGAVQLIEWDADNNGSFERREHTVPSNVGGDIVHPALTSTELTQPVSTLAPGLRTVQARVTDNGALDAADNIRRSLTFAGQLRVNAIPTAFGSVVTTNENQPVTIDLAGNDADAQPEPLRYEVVSPPPAGGGTLGPIVGNRVTFTPANGFNGTISFTFRTRDGGLSTVAAWSPSSTATVEITVRPVNGAPTVTPASFATDEDTPRTFSPIVQDDGPYTYAVFSQPANGSAACAPTGSCTYTPAADFFGQDTFVVQATDDGGLQGSATMSVTVRPVNDAPVAVDQSVTTPEDGTTTIVLAAADVDDTELTFTAPDDDVDHGSVSCDGGVCTFTPAPDRNGSDAFTFTVSDGEAEDTGTVEIDVTPVNDAPRAVGIETSTDEDSATPLTLGGTDVDGDTVILDAVGDPAHGTVTMDGGNDVTYTPDTDFSGVDTFQFDVSDGNGGSDTATVTITVEPVNDAPVAHDVTVEVDEDTPTEISASASDADGDELSWSIADQPEHGTLEGTGPDFTYTPDADFTGTDAFDVTVVDGNGAADTATITIDVQPVNDAPDAASGEVMTAEDTAVVFELEADDPDGDDVELAIATGPANGTLTCDGSSCTYVPAPNFNGADLVVFEATDGDGASDTGTVTITVTPVNDAPAALDALVATDEDTPVAVTIGAVDVDGDPLTFVAGTPERGTVSGIAPDVVYTPAPNTAGVDAFTFTVSDGNGASDTGRVDIQIAEVNDAPVVAPDVLTTPANTPVSFALEAQDVDGDAVTFSVVSPPASGSTECSPAGACSYAPALNTVGTFVVGIAAEDGRGGVGVADVTIHVVDVTPPTISLRSPADGSSVLYGSSIVVDYDCADDIALASCVGDAPDGATIVASEPGPATFSVRAADAFGNAAAVTAAYRVTYRFEGFHAPVDNGGVVNRAQAGSRIPLRWTISGAQGGVDDPASVVSLASRPVPCGNEAVEDVVEETTSTPGGLESHGGGRWQYSWATPKTWSGTCRELVLGLDDGTVHSALFSFR